MNFYDTLDKLCNEFERAGYRQQKEHAASFERLLDARELTFGSANDPMGFHTRHDPEEGKTILRGLKQAFDDVSARENRRGDAALLFKQKHRDKAAAFGRFSDLIGEALKAASR